MTAQKEQLKKYLSLPEGKVFGLGVILGLIFITYLTIYQRIFPLQADSVMATTLSHMFFGRAAGMFIGLSSGLNLFSIIIINMFIDTIWILFLYPLVLLSLKHILELSLFRKQVIRIQNIADKYKDLISKYGPVGLFLFVLCPLPMTGPIVGGVIGNLLGMRLRHTLIIIIVGCYMTILFWAFVLPYLQGKISHYGTTATIVVISCLILISVSAKVIDYLLHGEGGRLTTK